MAGVEAVRGFHVDFVLKKTVEKGSGDVSLVQWPAVVGSECEDCSERAGTESCGVSFKVVNPFLLHEPFGNPA